MQISFDIFYLQSHDVCFSSISLYIDKEIVQLWEGFAANVIEFELKDNKHYHNVSLEDSSMNITVFLGSLCK